MTNFYTITNPNISRFESTYEQVHLAAFVKNIVSNVTKYLVDEEAVFDELTTNETFLAEAEKARREITRNPSRFTNFTRKYSSLIE